MMCLNRSAVVLAVYSQVLERLTRTERRVGGARGGLDDVGVLSLVERLGA